MARSTSRAGRNTASWAGSESAAATFFVGASMVVLAVALAWGLLLAWPLASVEAGRTVWLNLTEARALVVTMIAGALGSYVHAATSFASFAGNRSLTPSWIWWFVLRIPIGGALALIVYFVIRSGLLLDGPLGQAVSPFGIAAVAAGAGLFSKQAVDKLKTICDTAFSAAGDTERNDKL